MIGWLKHPSRVTERLVRLAGEIRRVAVLAIVSIFIGLLSGQKAQAHAPFDCSARAIIHPDFLEVSVTVGSTLGESFLAGARVNPRQTASGHPFPMDTAFATNFFAVVGGNNQLSPREADVITDGLEFQFHFEYPLSPAKSLEFTPRFLPALKPPRAAALVLTDENGNILGSAILSEEKPAEFKLPERIFPQAMPATQASNTVLAETNSPPAILADTTIPKTSPSFTEFLKLGIEHILTGYDHLLFLVALLLGCHRLKTMLWVITGFTLAHSLTLALAALNLVTLSPRIVEPAIAASILFVALENLRRTEKGWQRYALTCGFGLIHGFGFASALRSTGLATNGSDLLKPLLAFNLGVEAGQLCVAAVVLPVLLILQRQPRFQKLGVRAVSLLVIAVAAWWLVSRIVSSGE